MKTFSGTSNDSYASRIAIANIEKRIRTLQETKQQLEKKITKYQLNVACIQNGDVQHQYKSANGMLNIITTKISNENCINNTNLISTSMIDEHKVISHHQETDNHRNQSNLASPLINHNTGTANNNQDSLLDSQNNSIYEPIGSSSSNLISNEIGKSHFYIDSNCKLNVRIGYLHT